MTLVYDVLELVGLQYIVISKVTLVYNVPELVGLQYIVISKVEWQRKMIDCMSTSLLNCFEIVPFFRCITEYIPKITARKLCLHVHQCFCVCFSRQCGHLSPVIFRVFLHRPLAGHPPGVITVCLHNTVVFCPECDITHWTHVLATVPYLG